MQGLWNLIGKVGQGAGKDFPYEIGEPIHGIEGNSVWTLHKGKNRTTGEYVSIFICDGKTSPPDELHVAKSGSKRLRTLRHPNVLKFIDGYETDALVYMVTELVQPLSVVLNQSAETVHSNLTSWGIHQITSTLSFLVNDSNLIHGNVNIFSIFVDQGGEWKVGGVDYVHPNAADPIARLTALAKYDPPEGAARNSNLPQWSTDAWGLGCLIWEIFNGPLKRPGDLKTLGKIPKVLVPHYCELVSANPKSRANPKQFLCNTSKPGQYLSNDFIRANLFLQEIQIKDIKEQKEFFQSINKSLDSFPEHFCVHKILPQLLNAFEYGAAGSTVLSPLFKVGKLLEDEEYQRKIVPCVIKLFSSNDRATRIQLLQQMDNFISHLQPGVVNDKIFPNIATGFGDTLPAMREQTIKCTVFLAPKLSEKTMNNHLLRYFAKLQMDEQPGIRTNTTICLGKIANYIPKATRSKVLVPAFVRATRDPFPPARSAAVLAMAATQDYYTIHDLATRLLPALSPLLIDEEKSVRTNTFKVVKSFTSKLEAASNDPESSLNKTENDPSKSDEAGSTWTGWAVSSLTSKFYTQGGSPQVTDSSKQNLPTRSDIGISSSSQKKEDTVSPLASKASDKEQSGSDYQSDGGWSDENWEDVREDVVTNTKKDLSFAGKKSIENHNHPPNDQDSDHSDYGDWGNDGWEFNDNQSQSQEKNMPNEDRTPSTLISQVASKREEKDFNTTNANFSFNINENIKSETMGDWDTGTNAWEEDWNTTAESETVEETSPKTDHSCVVEKENQKQSSKEARRAELLRIREERKQARKEGLSKQKKPGAMKLGGVRKVKENTDE